MTDSNENATNQANENKKSSKSIVKYLFIFILLAVILIFVVLGIQYSNYKKELPEMQKVQIREVITNLNQALSIGLTMRDGNYNNTDDVIENGIINQLSVKDKWSNAVELMNGTYVEFSKLRENCSNHANGNFEDTACAVIYIVSGVPFIGNIKFEQDQLKTKVYLYKNEIAF